jgi:glycosyltransferase involved in cell wall biosynthesis
VPEQGLAAAIDPLVADLPRAAAMGRAGRRRVLEEFGWERAAERTAGLYAALTAA